MEIIYSDNNGLESNVSTAAVTSQLPLFVGIVIHRLNTFSLSKPSARFAATFVESGRVFRSASPVDSMWIVSFSEYRWSDSLFLKLERLNTSCGNPGGITAEIHKCAVRRGKFIFNWVSYPTREKCCLSISGWRKEQTPGTGRWWIINCATMCLLQIVEETLGGFRNATIATE